MGCFVWLKEVTFQVGWLMNKGGKFAWTSKYTKWRSFQIGRLIILVGTPVKIVEEV